MEADAWEDDDSDLEDDRPRGDGARVDIAIKAAASTGKWKAPTAALDFGAVSWRPDLVDTSGKRRLLHTHLTDSILPYLERRLQAAHVAGWEVHLAVDEQVLSRPEFVGALKGLDVRIHLIRASGKPGAKSRDLLALLGLRSVALPHDTTVALAQSTWARIRDGSRNKRGLRFEGLLAFLFGQLKGLRIKSMNFITATEEIDIVLRCDLDMSRCWYEPGVPFILVEAKNHRKKVKSADVSSLMVKMQGKRRSCRLGVMCSTTGFSSKARNHELRLAATEYAIAMLGPDKLTKWIKSRDRTRWFEREIEDARLR